MRNPNNEADDIAKLTTELRSLGGDIAALKRALERTPPGAPRAPAMSSLTTPTFLPGAGAPPAPPAPGRPGGRGYDIPAPIAAPPLFGQRSASGMPSESTIPPPFGTGTSLGGNLSHATIHVQTATIHIQTATVNMPGGGSGTGNSGMPGGAPSTRGGKTAFPDAPAAPGQQVGGGASWRGMADDFMRNPTPAGAMNAVMNRMPVGVTALVGGVGHALTTAASGFYAGQQPIYQTETALMAARAGGQYISPAMERGMTEASLLRGTLAAERAWMEPLSSVPLLGAAANMAYGMFRGQPLERQIALTEAKARADEMRLRFGAAMGGAMGDAEDPFLESRSGLLSSAMMFGRGGIRGLSNFRFDRITGRGWSANDATSAASGVYEFAAGNPHLGFMARLAGGADISSMAAEIARFAATRGDFGLIARLTPMLKNSDGYLAEAQQSAQLTVDQQIGQLGISGAGAILTRMGYSGAGTVERAGQMAGIGSRYGEVIGVLEQRVAAERDPLRRAELSAQLEQARASQQGMFYQSVRTRYQGEEMQAGTALSSARISTERAMYGGSEYDVSGGFRAQVNAINQRAAVLRRMSGEWRFSPEERQQYASMAQESETEAAIGIPRAEGGFRLGLRSGEVGVRGATRGAALSHAELFGGEDAIFRARVGMVATTREQISLTRREMNGEFGPRSQQESLQLQERLVGLYRQLTEAVEQSTRAHLVARVQLAQTAQSITSSQQSAAFATGTGGVAGFGFAQRSYDAARGVADAAHKRVESLRVRGLAEDNPEMQQALRQAAGADAAATVAGLGRADVPTSIGLTREASSLNYQRQILSMLPGTYGSTRGLLAGSMRNLQSQSEEVMQRREAHRRANGGTLSEAEEHRYQEQLYALGLQQASTFSQLSYGWQSSLMSESLNTPGSFGFVGPAVSMRAATLAGVRNPAMGSTAGNVPHFLSQAARIGSIAGATGTPEGFATTAYVGTIAREGFAARPDIGGGASDLREALQGLTVYIRIPLPNGGFWEAPGEMVLRSTRGDTTPAAMSEHAARSGAGTVGRTAQ